MEADPPTIERLLFLLAETPQRIASACMHYENEALSFKASAADWSVNDNLAHLRACADVWGKSILLMIAQDHPTLRYISPRTWMRKTNYPALDFRTSFEAFAHQRKELLQVLNGLNVEDWSRGATFTGTTKGREQTVFSYAQRIVQHEAEHCEQIEKMLERG